MLKMTVSYVHSLRDGDHFEVRLAPGEDRNLFSKWLTSDEAEQSFAAWREVYAAPKDAQGRWHIEGPPHDSLLHQHTHEDRAPSTVPHSHGHAGPAQAWTHHHEHRHVYDIEELDKGQP